MAIDGSVLNGSAINGSESHQIDTNQYSITVECDGIFVGELLPTLYTASVLHGGKYFSEGYFGDIAPDNGKILVKQCTKTAISGIEIVKFGYNFYTPFKQMLYPRNKDYARASISITNGKLTSIDLIHGGSGYTTVPTIKLIGGGGKGGRVSCTVSGGVVTSVTIGSTGNFYTSPPVVLFDEEVAVINYTIGTIRSYPGYYDDSNSLVSDDSYIQDGIYYQNYSYELEVDELFDKYKNVVKSILHPAGYNMFGAITKFDSKLITAIAGIISLQIDRYPIDQFFPYDTIIKFISKPLVDNTEYLTDFYNYKLFKYLESDITLEELVYVTRLLSLAHQTSAVDTLTKFFDKNIFTSTGIISDIVYVQSNKLTLILNDSVYATTILDSAAYGTNYNRDYFYEDYAEDVDSITITIL